MLTKVAQTYDIESIMSFLRNPGESCNWYGSEEDFNEYKTTILEHILRKEAFIQVLNNKIVGFTLQAQN